MDTYFVFTPPAYNKTISITFLHKENDTERTTVVVLNINRHETVIIFSNDYRLGGGNKAFAQSQNVKCIYAATHVISDAVRNIEDAHIRELVIQKFQNDKKTFTMLYADGKYSFNEGSNNGDAGIKTIGGAADIYIDTAKDSVYAQKYIVDKLFLIKDKYKPYDWTLTKETKTINGKVCTKATTSGNIPVTAWFCTDIPLNVGPLGYLGLPGIIMQLDTPTYSYVLQEMVNLKDTPTFEVPTKGKVISQEEFNKLEAEKMKSRGTEAGKVRIIRI